MQQMTPGARQTRARLLGRLLPAALFLFACGGATSAGGPPTASTATPAPRATATPAGPPSHAFAWTQYDTHYVPQIWASINGAAPAQITHLPPPPPSDSGCGDPLVWGLPVFSPDLKHIAAAAGSFNCGDGVMSGPLSIINVATGASAPVPHALQVRVTQRSVGWLDNNTIYWVDAGGRHTYVLGAPSAATLPGVSGLEEAVLRGTTLFYLHPDSGGLVTLTWTESLRRYDMTAHTALPGSIALGQYRSCECSLGDYHTAGWDVSPDGTHVVYQHMVPLTGTEAGLASSQIMYANADGSGATHIAQTLDATGLVRIQFAPNGGTVAIVDGSPSEVAVTASVSSPGGPTDPTYNFYRPVAVAFPVWKWDSSSFWAGTSVLGGSDAPVGSLYYYTVGHLAGVIGVVGGYDPWYTIGH